MKVIFHTSTIFLISFILISNVLWGYLYLNIKSEKQSLVHDSLDFIITPLHISPEFYPDLKYEILINGSEDKYTTLKNKITENGISEYLLPWSLIMLNKYNYVPAYYDIYYCLAASRIFEKEIPLTLVHDDIDGVFYIPLDHLDEKTRNMALDYLVKASEKNVKEAKKELGAYYITGKYFPKNVELGQKLIEESKSK